MARPLTDTLQEYGRGVAGGLLFSLPLLYTMEVWWQGQVAEPERLLAYLVGMFALLVAYAHFVGLHEDRHLGENVFEALEAVALGALVTAVVLTLTGQLSAATSVDEAVGKLVMEGMAVAVGVAVGSAQLGAGNGEEDEKERAGEDEQEEVTRGGLSSEVALALLGAVLVAANVAPTEEMVMIAGAMPPWALPLLAVFSYGLVLGLVSYAEFRGSQRLEGWMLAGHPVAGAAITYGVALLASAALLWAFGRFDGAGVPEAVGQTVVLGLPAALGAAVGRLLLASPP